MAVKNPRCDDHCKDHTGVEAVITMLTKFKDRLEGANGNQGILQRIFDSIDTKISKGLCLTLMAAILLILSTCFTLLYHSQSTMKEDLTQIMVSVSAIKKEIEIMGK